MINPTRQPYGCLFGFLGSSWVRDGGVSTSPRRRIFTETAWSSLDDASGIACVCPDCLVKNPLAEARSDTAISDPGASDERQSAMEGAKPLPQGSLGSASVGLRQQFLGCSPLSYSAASLLGCFAARLLTAWRRPKSYRWCRSAA
jgi:hypothetical protein